jgi:hypothetical protein
MASVFMMGVKVSAIQLFNTDETSWLKRARTFAAHKK